MPRLVKQTMYNMNTLLFLFLLYSFGLSVPTIVGTSIFSTPFFGIDADCDCSSKVDAIDTIEHLLEQEIIKTVDKTPEQIKEEAWSDIDSFIESLGLEDWNDNEACYKSTEDLLRSVKNNTLWAIWIWDSMQPPAATLYGSRYHLGNYDQCLQSPWTSSHPKLKSQYCLVDVMFEPQKERTFDVYASAKWYLQTYTDLGRHLNEHTIGVCLPAMCDAASIAKISKRLLDFWNKRYLPSSSVSVDPRDCQKAGRIEEYSMEFYTFWSTFLVLMVVAIVSTFYNKVVIRCRHFDPIANTFCLENNVRNLFKTSKSDIHVLYGMRTLTSLSFVILHEIMFFAMPFTYKSNSIEFDQVFSSKTGRILLHADILVDTFFMMSGLLFIRGLLRRNYIADIKLQLVKRYLRFIGPYAVVTLYYVSSLKHAGDGPLWNRCRRMESDHCDDFWWLNFLMINLNVDSMCNFMSWYVPCDFQLTILGAGLFYLLKKNCKLGTFAFAMIICGVSLNLGSVVYHNNLPILPLQGLNTIMEIKNHKSFNLIYVKSWHRAGPYLVGMLMAFIMAAYRPLDYRKSISKARSLSLLLVSLAIMGLVFCIGLIFSGEYDPFQAAVVAATNRTVWAMALCCIVGVSEYGSVPLLNYLLGWSGFVPLSKLSYCLYLIHPFIIRKRLYSVRSGMHFSFFNTFVNGAGTTVISLIPVALVYLLVEAPMANLTNLLMPENKDIGGNTDPQTTEQELEDLQQYYMPKQKIT